METTTTIDSIDIYRVSMPLVYPFRTNYGDDYAIESVLVKMTSGDHYGWGEASPMAAQLIALSGLMALS